MKLHLKNLIIVSFLLVFGDSCNTKNDNCLHSDMVNLNAFYNSTKWKPFLENRVASNKQLQNRIMEMSSIFREFASYAINSSGGINTDGNLVNSCVKIQINKYELDILYDNIVRKLNEIESVDEEKKAFTELSEVINYNFLEKEGSLRKEQIHRLNSETIASKFLFYENFCFYIIVKYC